MSGERNTFWPFAMKGLSTPARSPLASVCVAKEVEAMTSMLKPEMTFLMSRMAVFVEGELFEVMAVSMYRSSRCTATVISGTIARSFPLVKEGLVQERILELKKTLFRIFKKFFF